MSNMTNMIKEEEHKKSGRPPISIDWKAVDQALIAGSSGKRIAASLGIHYDTLYHAVEREFGISFTDYSAGKKAKGEVLIEMAQFDEAVRKRDRGMLIWLGKQRLGQRENHDISLKGEGFIAKVINYGESKESTPYACE